MQYDNSPADYRLLSALAHHRCGRRGDARPPGWGTVLAALRGMPRLRRSNNPWEPELLRIGRRLLRGAVTSGTQLAIGGFDSIESALSQAVTLPGERAGLRLVAASSNGPADCLADE